MTNIKKMNEEECTYKFMWFDSVPKFTRCAHFTLNMSYISQHSQFSPLVVLEDKGGHGLAN